MHPDEAQVWMAERRAGVHDHEDEQEEVAQIITDALMTYKPPRTSNNKLARGRHITDTLADHGWVLIKEEKHDGEE